jgi:hypothetical protein
MLEKTTYENFCQKGPPAGGGMFGQATRGTRAAWVNAGMGVPPSPSPARRLAGDGGGACRLSRCRQGDVAHACRIW